jgi:two-component system OmpR family sensor kinase
MLDQRWRSESVIPKAVTGVGIGRFVAVVATQVAFNVSAPRDLLTPNVVVSVATVSPFALGRVYGGEFVRTSTLDERRYPRIGTWCGGGLAGLLGLNLVMIVVWPPGRLANVIGWALFAASVGGGGGLAIGIVEARAIERARRAERVTVRAEHLDAQREWLGYLNSLLRHEVLNNANVIEGYASLLAGQHDDEPTAERLDVIRTQSRRMIEVIDDVRVLIEAAEADPDPEFDRVRLAEALSAEVDDPREAHPEATIHVSVPEEVCVVADSLLDRVFANLLSNAIEHNDSDRPEVRITAERAGETVELTDTGPSGSTFTVELPACSDEPTAAVGAGGVPTAAVSGSPLD